MSCAKILVVDDEPEADRQGEDGGGVGTAQLRQRGPDSAQYADDEDADREGEPVAGAEGGEELDDRVVRAGRAFGRTPRSRNPAGRPVSLAGMAAVVGMTGAGR